MCDLSGNWGGLLDDGESDCRYILGSKKACAAPRKDDASSYCSEHHALCYLTPAQAKERLHEFETLARVVGGRLAARKILSARELRRIERRAEELKSR